MDAAIERLILLKRKECYNLLVKKKEIKPAAWFILNGPNGLYDIMIRGTEEFFESSEGKRKLQAYFKLKWEQYKIRLTDELYAVVVMSDMWYVQAARTAAEQLAEFIEANKDVIPSEHPERKQCIGFAIHSANERNFTLFEYEKSGKTIQWGHVVEEADMDLFGNMGDLFPHQ